jgi:hypothetical protein
VARRSREVPRPELRCPRCEAEVERFWEYCSDCGRGLVWRDAPPRTGAECFYCGWLVSDRFAFCPWCGRAIADADSSATPLKAPIGFRYDRRCQHGCGGGVMYPMRFCPWCGRPEQWPDRAFQNICPHCDRGVNDWMDVCPWCGQDATGRDLIPRALRRVRRLLALSRITRWEYRVLLRPGVSGVAHRAPKIIEVERRYVTNRWRSEISWNLLTGLLLHELGHSFLFHHWGWTRTGRFRRAFGEVRIAYRVSDSTWVDFERRGVTTTLPDYVTAYAATHPQEDFAETFRLYVTRRARLRELFAEFGRKRKGVPVFEKVLVLHDYVRGLRGWS